MSQSEPRGRRGAQSSFLCSCNISVRCISILPAGQAGHLGVPLALPCLSPSNGPTIDRYSELIPSPTCTAAAPAATTPNTWTTQRSPDPLLHSSLAPHDLASKQPGDPFHNMSLLCSKPLCFTHSSRIRFEVPVVYRILPDLPWLPLTSSPSLSPLLPLCQPHRPLCCSRKMTRSPLPQGLCTCCPPPPMLSPSGCLAPSLFFFFRVSVYVTYPKRPSLVST